MIPFVGLFAEALRTFNNIYEDTPKAQRMAFFLGSWNVLWKPLLMPNLSPQQKAMVEQLEREMLPLLATATTGIATTVNQTQPKTL
jgi:hypothetical protein